MLSGIMNRRKKIQQLLTAHAKKKSAKLAPHSKERYISKADRAKMGVESLDGTVVQANNQCGL